MTVLVNVVEKYRSKSNDSCNLDDPKMKCIFYVLLVVLCARSSAFTRTKGGLGGLRPRLGGISIRISKDDLPSVDLKSIKSLKTTLSSVDLKQIDELVEGDKIFKLHSVGAVFFGITLLFFPDVILKGGPIASFAYQQWSIFILAVAYITYNVPADKHAKTLLANTFCGMCSAEALLYTIDILRTLFRTPINIFVIDVSSLAVFAFLALGYLRSGNTSLGQE